jgi:hypothetical protein
MDLLYRASQAYTNKLTNKELKNKIKCKPYVQSNSLMVTKPISNDLVTGNRNFDFIKQRNLFYFNPLGSYKKPVILSLMYANQNRQLHNIIYPDINKIKLIDTPNEEPSEPDFTILGLLVIGAGIVGFVNWWKS